MPFNFDMVRNISSINNTHSLIQIDNRNVSSNGYKTNEVKTYIINNKEGSGFFISRQLPLILSITDNRIAFLKNKEFPQVEISEY